MLVGCGVACAALLVTVGPVTAKLLPVDSVLVETARPQATRPIDIVVRFGNDFDLGDEFDWAQNEVSVLPVERTDTQGWPLERTDRGQPVALRRVGVGAYRGSFVVSEPGTYVIVEWSSFYAKEGRSAGVAAPREYPAPIKVQVAEVAATTHATGSSSGDSGITAPLALAGVAIAAVAATAALYRRRAKAAGAGTLAGALAARALDGP